ncbi:MAG: hypothetical protein ACFFB0_08770 [Promethearchaeota archaeon]
MNYICNRIYIKINKIRGYKKMKKPAKKGIIKVRNDIICHPIFSGITK